MKEWRVPLSGTLIIPKELWFDVCLHVNRDQNWAQTANAICGTSKTLQKVCQLNLITLYYMLIARAMKGIR